MESKCLRPCWGQPQLAAISYTHRGGWGPGGGHPQLVSSPIGLIDYTETNIGGQSYFYFLLKGFFVWPDYLKMNCREITRDHWNKMHIAKPSFMENLLKSKTIPIVLQGEFLNMLLIQQCWTKLNNCFHKTIGIACNAKYGCLTVKHWSK